jgi:hypothetical protein
MDEWPGSSAILSTSPPQVFGVGLSPRGACTGNLRHRADVDQLVRMGGSAPEIATTACPLSKAR